MSVVFAASGSSGGALPVLLIAIGAVAVVVLVRRARSRNRARGLERIGLRMELVGAVDYFPVGFAIAGLGADGMGPVVCAPGRRDLVFMPAYSDGSSPGDPSEPAPVLARIPRDAVSFLGVKDATQTQMHVQTVQRLSVTRMALLGPLSLAAPKRKRLETKTTISKFYLVVDWTDRKGIGQESIFEFARGSDANQAEDWIRSSLRAKPSRPKVAEQRSPQPSLADELASLDGLRSAGFLTLDEFALRKDALLSASGRLDTSHFAGAELTKLAALVTGGTITRADFDRQKLSLLSRED